MLASFKYTVERVRKLVSFNVTKIQFILFDVIGVKMDDSIHEEKSFLKMLG